MGGLPPADVAGPLSSIETTPDPAPARPHVDRPPHAYPRDLARLVRRRWRDVPAQHAARRPRLAALERLLSTCYQASLLREEDRPVTFRLAVDNPANFPAEAGPPTGWHRLQFSRSRPLDAHELRRLAPAAVFARSLIGVRLGREGARVWGLLHSGVDWLETVQASRAAHGAVPVLVVSVSGPGCLLVTLAGTAVAELRHGRMRTLEMDVFDAPWLAEIFRDVGDGETAPTPFSHPAPGPPTFGARLATDVLRQAVRTMRAEQHGGMLIVLPGAGLRTVAEARTLRIKYEFTDEEPRRRVETTAVKICASLALATSDDRCLPGWDQFVGATSPLLQQARAALGELAHLVAGLSHVDGAVVLTDRLEILGFGAEIAGDLPRVTRVAQAADLTGDRRHWVRSDRVGTRHRSAYRLCQAVRDALVLVVSQDGGLKAVRWHLDGVTYWKQVARGPWEG
jgi:hypothetical protein